MANDLEGSVAAVSLSIPTGVLMWVLAAGDVIFPANRHFSFIEISNSAEISTWEL